MSDTPRTDAEQFVEKSKDNPFVEAAFARQLEPELAEAKASLERGAETAAKMLEATIKERDKARECLREAIAYRDRTMSGYDLQEWIEALGLTNSETDKNAPTINREDKNSTNHIGQFVLGKGTAEQLLNYLGVSSYVVYQMNVTKHFHGEVDIFCRLYDIPKSI
jgi:hypothetical protein